MGAAFAGPTGLLRTPNAAVLSTGRFRLSFTNPAEVATPTIPEYREQWTFTTGILPGVEFGGADLDTTARSVDSGNRLLVTSAAVDVWACPTNR